jgi:membrane glycosyltransferase
MTVVLNASQLVVPGMPPPAPLAMPTQDLRASGPARSRAATARVRVGRLITFGSAAALSFFGAYEMISVVSAGGITLMEAVFTALFIVNFAWIALAATTAAVGIVPGLGRRSASGKARRLTSRTALVMPVYQESASATAAALEAMARGLAALGQAHAFEIVILSDSTSADAWVAEIRATDLLDRTLRGTMPVWYRRRWRNTGKKAGNLREFIEHWGGRYDHFIVLDADSLMAPDTVVALAARMEEDQSLGLLQTPPFLCGGVTLFARLQQFAGRIYGPVLARGLAIWSGSQGNYWGHNAIIRTRAFAACCGLPDLPGSPPLGGPIMSHDFVEAGLLVRAGWGVEMDCDLAGSWEGGPPSLLASAARDRRWVQGNLQHAKVIRARGLSWASRVHLTTGIMSYLASPFWLLLVASGVILSVQADLVLPDYFSETYQLFPDWPLLDAERMMRLFVFSLGVLLLPKAIGLLVALISAPVRRASGGALRLTIGATLEIVLAALYAPVMMAIHVQHVTDVLLGRDSGWSSQSRDGETGWREAWRKHRWQMLFGAVVTAGAWFVTPTLLAWLSPMLAGFLLAAPLSWASGSAGIGRGLRRAGLLLTEEETRPHPVLAARDSAEAAYDAPARGIRVLATDPTLRDTHLRWVNPPPRLRGAPEPAFLTAAAKIADATTIDEALDWFTADEELQVAGEAGILAALAALPSGQAVRSAA